MIAYFSGGWKTKRPTSTHRHCTQLQIDGIDVHHGIVHAIMINVWVTEHALCALRDDITLALQHAHVKP